MSRRNSDASVAKGFVSLERIQSGKEMLLRTVAMLTKLVLRFDPDQYRVRESASGLAAPFEHETSELVRQGFLRRFYSQLWMKLSGGLGVL
jgi:hypothetical protein